MSKQYIAISEQTARNELNYPPTYQFYPVSGKLDPTVEFKEDPVHEWRGQDTAQGDVSDERTSTSWKYTLEGRVYPGPELALMLKYLFGFAGSPVTQNTNYSRVLYRSTSDMFGDDTSLLDGALAIIPNSIKTATTYSQAYMGGRIPSCELSFKGGEAAMMKLDFIGGPWINPPGQTAVPGCTFPKAKAFRAVPKIYLGDGADLTGEAPNYTNFACGSMTMALPDDLTIKIETGIVDKHKMNGIDGPSVTEREKQWLVTIEYTIDFSDPASAWSSYDAWAARFSDIQYAPFMLILDSTDASYINSQLGLYLPKVKITTETPDRKNDGTKDKIKVKLESRADPNINVAAFAKLVYRDTTPPIVTLFTVPDTSYSYTIPVTAFIHAVAGGDTVKFLITETNIAPVYNAPGWSDSPPANYTVAEDGVYTLYPWVMDQKFNISPAYLPQICTVTNDTTAPIVTGFTADATSASFSIPISVLTYTADAGETVKFLITETGTTPVYNAPGWSDSLPTSYTVGATGEFTLYAWVMDQAYNISSQYTPQVCTVTGGGA